jgi:GntR family trehalose operon transcriptional repressor
MIMADPRRYRHIYAEVSARIKAGTYPAGSPLPPIGQLADEFDVSRDTVQRALQLLAEGGLIQRWPGLGWYVKDKS